ncbi:MAG TPA: hypothetical protein VLI90_18085, partial [Tepidisphaeraceae bacterium]|nr:hypothetical protein [Tepidisphaeraceae bacterium]
MPSPLPLSIASPGPLLAAGALLLVLMIIAFIRRLALARASQLLLAMGLILLTLAAGEPQWWRVATSSVVVMVDLSPSTRGATFRHRDALIARVHQLLGNQP